MEVILKKTKITASLLKQAMKINLADIANGNILGWCVYNKAKHIVCHNDTTGIISIFMLFKSINYKLENDKHRSVVKFYSNYIDVTYSHESKRDAELFIDTFSDAKNQAEQKGQFYL